MCTYICIYICTQSKIDSPTASSDLDVAEVVVGVAALPNWATYLSITVIRVLLERRILLCVPTDAHLQYRLRAKAAGARYGFRKSRSSSEKGSSLRCGFSCLRPLHDVAASSETQVDGNRLSIYVIERTTLVGETGETGFPIANIEN